MITILVVDDHPTVRRSIEDILHAVSGMRCIGTAPDGREAIVLAERHSPDVVLMDISSPHYDGISTTEQIRTRWPNTKVVAHADWESSVLTRRALDAGASAHLVKRCDPHVLLRAIEEAAAA